jgi:isocitrate dehydrogenase kinase/phosphatase
MKKNKKRIRLLDRAFLKKCIDPNYYNDAGKLYIVKKKLLKLSEKYRRQNIKENLQNEVLCRSLLIVSARRILVGGNKNA